MWLLQCGHVYTCKGNIQLYIYIQYELWLTLTTTKVLTGNPPKRVNANQPWMNKEKERVMPLSICPSHDVLRCLCAIVKHHLRTVRPEGGQLSLIMRKIQCVFCNVFVVELRIISHILPLYLEEKRKPQTNTRLNHEFNMLRKSQKMFLRVLNQAEIISR